MNALVAHMLFTLPAALFAQETAPASGSDSPAGAGPWNFVVLAFIMLLVFWLMALPGRKRDKEARKMIDSLKINDRVLTTSGIIGTIYSVDKEAGEVVLRVDDAVKIKFTINAIYFVYNKEAAENADKNKNNKAK